jgi:hypothetical protein
LRRPRPRIREPQPNKLWSICNFPQQEAICSRFVTQRSEVLRDALLDDRISVGPGAPGRLGAAVWSDWIVFRDDYLREMVRRGEIRLNS